MDLGIVDQILSENLDLYERAISGIRQCLPTYERRCAELIGDIAASRDLAGTDEKFDELFDIQGRLATLLFKHNFDIGSKLKSLTKEFDRLHDPYIREYWYNKFKNGASWPEPPITSSV